MIASNSGPRWRTRIRTSPGRVRAALPTRSRADHGAWRSSRQPHRAGWSRWQCRTARPSLRSRASRRARSAAQISTRPGAASRQRLMRGDAGVGRSVPLRTTSRRRTPYRPRQHVRARAERMVELQINASPVRPSSIAALESTAHVVEASRRGALEREDRLLLVADREDRARDVPRAPAPAVNSADQLRDDLPLLRARVLRLVDQHVVDAEVELVVHPGGVDAASSSASVLSIRSS